MQGFVLKGGVQDFVLKGGGGMQRLPFEGGGVNMQGFVLKGELLLFPP